MSKSNGALGEITKIGNYAIPAFGAFITAALAMGSFSNSASDGQAVVVNFAIYTMVAAWVSYFHRIFYLRHRRIQKEKDQNPTNLPTWAVIIFLIIHLGLVIVLSYKLWPLGLIM